MKIITKEFLYDKAMELTSVWNTLEIIDKDVIPNSEMVAERSLIVGKLEMINELIEYINETTG
jgi:rRNA processing protein Krr1/Pno1